MRTRMNYEQTYRNIHNNNVIANTYNNERTPTRLLGLAVISSQLESPIDESDEIEILTPSRPTLHQASQPNPQPTTNTETDFLEENISSSVNSHIYLGVDPYNSLVVELFVNRAKKVVIEKVVDQFKNRPSLSNHISLKSII